MSESSEGVSPSFSVGKQLHRKFRENAEILHENNIFAQNMQVLDTKKAPDSSTPGLCKLGFRIY